jgi:hypothetical protein
MQTCSLCGRKARELCPDLACPRCHVSLSFSDSVYQDAKQWKVKS